MRNIQSVRVKGKTVYVNFDNGTFGTRSFSQGKWYTAHLTEAEFAEARKLAHDGKCWHNYTAPRQVTIAEYNTSGMHSSHDDEDTGEAEFNAKNPGKTVMY